MADIWDAKYRAEQHGAQSYDLYSPTGRHIVRVGFDGPESLEAFVMDMIDEGWFRDGDMCFVGNHTLFFWRES